MGGDRFFRKLQLNPMTADHPNPSKPRRRWFQFSLRTLFVLVTVAAFYAWLFITLEPRSAVQIVMVVWLYAIITVVTVLMFRTRGKVIIGVAAGFILFNFPYFQSYTDAGDGVVANILPLLFIGAHGAGICGGIDAIYRKHRVAGWTAIKLTCVSVFAFFCLMCIFLLTMA